ncbi:MAG: DAK2 domain-containing protein [Tissierellia bacterium]|nr:DAK2 domain-containing protein [Tissierellia bacterium]
MKFINGKTLAGCIVSAYENLNDKKDEVNELNVFPVPDGDTGTNMTMTIKSAANKVTALSNKTIIDVSKALGQGSLMGARGNSGVILSQLCRGVSKSLKGKEKISAFEIRDCFLEAKKTAYKAVMKPTEGTILTVCRKMAEASEQYYEDDIEIDKYLYRILLEGKKALKETPKLLPVLKEANVVDAGGQGLIYLLEGAVKYLNEKIEDEFEYSDSDIENYDFSLNAICVNYKDDLRDDLEDFCLIDRFEDNKYLSLEIKTHDIEQAISILFDKAQIVKLDLNKDDFEYEEKLEQENLKEMGIVAVSKGAGFDQVFKSLNTDYLISGGQTMNPSTEDINNAVEKVNAKNIFILPNNKNIIMAAKQVEQLSDKNIYVLETKSIPQGFCALLAYDQELSVEENFENMKEAMQEVTVCEITYSIRDTKVGNLDIKKDDIIGLISGQIKVNGKDIDNVLLKTVETAMVDDVSLITLYYGDQVKKEDAEKIKNKLSQKFEDCDVELVDGGQPLYYYSISLE